MLLVVWNLFGYDFVFFCLIVYVCCICVVLVLFVCIVIDVLFIVIVILMIDYLSCGMFDDWLCCVGYGYDCLCIDDFLCCVGYWLLCFEYLLDLFVVCDMCVFDFFVVQCEIVCWCMMDVIQVLCVCFVGIVVIVLISQCDVEFVCFVCFVVGVNEYYLYIVLLDMLIVSIVIWLCWFYYCVIYYCYWCIGVFEFDMVMCSVNVVGCEYVLIEKYFQIVIVFFLNMGCVFDCVYVSQFVWGLFVVVFSWWFDMYVVYLCDWFEFDGWYGVKMMMMYGFGYWFVMCELGMEFVEEDVVW